MTDIIDQAVAIQWAEMPWLASRPFIVQCRDRATIRTSIEKYVARFEQAMKRAPHTPDELFVWVAADDVRRGDFRCNPPRR